MQMQKQKQKQIMQRARSPFPDWAHLPPLVVDLISQKVKSITDYVRFRAVCSPWRSASLPVPRHLPPQLPWLMLPWHEDEAGTRLFYDPCQSKTLQLHLPETLGMTCSASYRGWLFLDSQEEGADLFLLNPLTRAQIQLPPFISGVAVGLGEDLLDDDYDLTDIEIIKLTFSTDLSDPDCLIIAFLRLCRWIFCCRVGDPRWTKVFVYDDPEVCPDGTYYNGRFYVLCCQDLLTVIDSNRLHDDRIVYDLLQQIPGTKFILHGAKSGVYVVALHDIIPEEEQATAQKHKDDPPTHDAKGKTAKTLTSKQQLKIDLYQFIEQPLQLNNITNTTDTALFFADNFYCLAVCSDDWHSLPGGSVYIQDKYVLSVDTTSCNIFSGKLSDFKYELVAYQLTEQPSIWPSPPAMWFQPSFV